MWKPVSLSFLCWKYELKHSTHVTQMPDFMRLEELQETTVWVVMVQDGCLSKVHEKAGTGLRWFPSPCRRTKGKRQGKIALCDASVFV